LIWSATILGNAKSVFVPLECQVRVERSTATAEFLRHSANEMLYAQLDTKFKEQAGEAF
jgi:hypothetical protein